MLNTEENGEDGSFAFTSIKREGSRLRIAAGSVKRSEEVWM
jgi:hypothetical protein